MKRPINFTEIFAWILIFSWPLMIFGQGTFTVTFDGAPVPPPSSAAIIQGYGESHMEFFPLQGSDGFGRVGSNPLSFFPNNGTCYLDAALGDSLGFSYNAGAFTLISVDLAGYSSVVPDADIEIIGYRTDDSTVSADVIRHGIDFETYYFGPEWSSLYHVEIPNPGWSLDNLVVGVPEPGTGVLVIVGALALWLSRKIRVSSDQK